FGDKSKSFTGDGPDKSLFSARVTNSGTRSIDATGQGRVRDNPSAPHSREQIVSAHDAITISDQVGKNVKDLWLHSDELRVALELAPLNIEREAAKGEHLTGLGRLGLGPRPVV